MTAMRHLQRKPPRKTRGFSWARVPHDDLGALEYRLFRGDANGVVHVIADLFFAGRTRGEIAKRVWQMRIRLRDRVDELTLQQLGVIP